MLESVIKTIELNGYRFYKIRGNYYPSVTSILSIKENPALERWKRSLTPTQVQAILDYTSTRGEVIHYLALKEYETNTVKQDEFSDESIDLVNQDEKMREEVWRAISQFHNFQSRYTLEAKHLEKVVWNDEYHYAGRVDFVGWLIDKGTELKRPIIMDIKTSKQIYPKSVGMQLGAYNFALGDWATELWVLLLHPGSTTVDGVTIGANKPFWQFKQVDNSFPEFMYYEMLFRPKTRQILTSHELK